MGVTLGPPGAGGFQDEQCTRNGRAMGLNSKVVKDRCRSEALRQKLMDLWATLKRVVATAYPDYRFSSAAVLKNFTGKPHVDRNNTTHQVRYQLRGLHRRPADGGDRRPSGRWPLSTPAAGPRASMGGGRTGFRPTRASATV